MIETYAGIEARLAITASDGSTALYIQASVFDDSGTVIETLDMVHKSLGLYRGNVLISEPGVYHVVYRNFLDAGHTLPDPDREQDQETILVRPLDQPNVGVVYDSTLARLLFEITVSRQGQPLTADELTSATIVVYDDDDHELLTVEDLVPDSLGVFRLTHVNPTLIADRLYYLRVTVVTTAGTVVANRGFQTTE